VFPEVAAFILDRIRVAQLSKKSDFFKNILPLFQTLLSHIRHFFNSHNFFSEGMSGVIYSAKTSVADFTQIFENSFWIVMIKEISYLWILETTSPKNMFKRKLIIF
jgi:hypothetical protein